MTETTRPVPDPVMEYPLQEAVEEGVLPILWPEAKRRARLDLTDDDGTRVPLILTPYGDWHAKRYTGGRTLTGYAGRHAPTRGGVPGLSAEGVRRAVDALDAQEAGLPAYRACPTCGHHARRAL
jgi:hypothetical protein